MSRRNRYIGKKYRVAVDFAVKYEHSIMCFDENTKWKYCGESNGYVSLNRGRLFMDVSEELFRNNFVEEGKSNDNNGAD